MSTAEGTAQLFKFVNATKRLQQTFGDLKFKEQDSAEGDARGSGVAARPLRQTTLRFNRTS